MGCLECTYVNTLALSLNFVQTPCKQLPFMTVPRKEAIDNEMILRGVSWAVNSGSDVSRGMSGPLETMTI